MVEVRYRFCSPDIFYYKIAASDFGIFAPFNKSQKPSAISSMAIGPKQAGIMNFSTAGKTRIANWLNSNNKEENTRDTQSGE